MIEARRRFVQYLKHHALVEDVGFTRDGYRTVVLQLGDLDESPTELDECIVCGATGLAERIEEHDCEAFVEWRRSR